MKTVVNYKCFELYQFSVVIIFLGGGDIFHAVVNHHRTWHGFLSLYSPHHLYQTPNRESAHANV